MNTYIPGREAKMKTYAIGDILQSEYGYQVIVQRGDDGELEGRLVCEPGHPCENIPYSLSGKYVVVGRMEAGIDPVENEMNYCPFCGLPLKMGDRLDEGYTIERKPYYVTY
jgi:hypothetical protein